VIESGNPVRAPTAVDRTEARRAFALPVEGRVVLVVGGSQGSLALNRAVLDAVRGVSNGQLERPEDLTLLWSTGPAHLAEVEAELDGLGRPDWVRAVGYIDRMDQALAAADLALSRAGAMATSEFLAWGLPSVLVPLPTAAADHQSENARSLELAGAAVHLPENALVPGALWRALLELGSAERLALGREAALRRARPEAAARIASDLERLLPTPHGRSGALSARVAR
jgi:UDP-N-acetylglucosamine--N-acetylmuramyl-(pentapeptide) pyrophosphoryl-undecaprenol N-acetylglucosamine transferase